MLPTYRIIWNKMYFTLCQFYHLKVECWYWHWDLTFPWGNGETCIKWKNQNDGEDAQTTVLAQLNSSAMKSPRWSEAIWGAASCQTPVICWNLLLCRCTSIL